MSSVTHSLNAGPYPITLTVSPNTCTVNSVTYNSMGTQTYVIGNGQVIYTMSPYTATPSCSFTFSYAATLSSGGALPSFVVFDASALTFTVETTDTTDAASYAIQITGTLDDTGPTSDSTHIFTLIAAAYAPPYFESSIEAMTIQAGQELSYALPTSVDPQGGQITYAVTLGSASSFVTFIEAAYTFVVSPPVDAESGSYTVQIALTDEVPLSSAPYSF